MNVRNNDGYTVLMNAAENGKLEIVRYFVEHCGADVNAKDRDGETALMRATKDGKMEVIRYFVEHCKADVDAKSNAGNTAVRFASDRGYHEIQSIFTPFLRPPRQPCTSDTRGTTDNVVLASGCSSSCSIPPSEIELIFFSQNSNIGGEFRAK